MAGHEWYYIQSGWNSDQTIGPIAESEFVTKLSAGEIKPTTNVCSQSRTRGQWLTVDKIQSVMQVWQKGDDKRKAEQQTIIAQKQELATEHRRIADIARSEAAQQRHQYVQQMAQVSDCTDPAQFEVITQRVQGILTSGERIEYIAVQRKPLINLAPDAMVVTSKRLIFYRPKLLGRFEFADYLWIDLHNAHIKQNLMGAIFWATHVSGQVVQMDYLSKEGSQRLYRVAQEREETARLERLEMHRETLRAGASQINVQTVNAPQNVPVAPQNDLISRLQQLKQMADAGLITPDEFAERKKQILAQV